MHSADPAVATPWPALAHVMDAVDSVTVELVLDDEATKAMGQAMVLTDGRVLGDIAGPDRMAHIEAVGAMYGMPPEALQQFRPWAVNMLFSACRRRSCNARQRARRCWTMFCGSMRKTVASRSMASRR
jgi:uncharacterized protein YbaP (TraB family)